MILGTALLVPVLIAFVVILAGVGAAVALYTRAMAAHARAGAVAVVGGAEGADF